MLSPVIRNGMELYKTNNYNHHRTKNLKNQGSKNFKISNSMKNGIKQKVTPDENLCKPVTRSNLGSKNNITILEKITEGEELETSNISQSQSSNEKNDTNCCIFNTNYKNNQSKRIFQRFTDICANSIYRLYYRIKNKRGRNSKNIVNENTVNQTYSSNEKIPYLIVNKNDVTLLN
ncbi:Hypothetical protein SRAE_X000230500 [Strongyloides ratti]|uniref:Uncharacterized protein n=1 Tax=Strongyloides ratti TaxID=34506 RepID=A0A090KZA8_STRRB|nr:Hypothetical protein SRAE_X000230500 [Strongyloides ratti]CEF60569.1 Hypothetical protein SRAE_X000230500 [Strongyloides ratti]